MNVHIRVILSICLIIHSSVLLIVINIWSNVDCMIITIEIIIPSTTLHVSLSIRSDTSIHSHPHSMLLLTSTPLILIYLLISVSSIIELDPMLIQSLSTIPIIPLFSFIHISIQTEMMIHTDSNEREKNSIETSQRVKHTGTNSTRNDLAS